MSLEKLDINNYDYIDLDKMNIEFDMTSTINSKFMFTFVDYNLKYALDNYPQSMPIARNNEEVLYSVPYINYIRTGYNYDVKNKNIQIASNMVGLGLSGLSIGASLLAPSVPLKVAGIVASLVSMANSIKGAVVNGIQQENTIKQKMFQSQNQTASVSGSDDVDLMSIYAKNRLKYLVYKPMPIMEDMIFKLFFYAGYNSGRIGIPNHNTRCNFDYLECDASVESAGANIPEEILEELKNCFKVGVTYIHKTTRVTDKWDIEQKYENWEKELIQEE